MLKMVLLAILSRYFLCCADSFRECAYLPGFGNALRVRAYGSGFGHRFAIGCALRIGTWVCLRRLALASHAVSLPAFALASDLRFGFGRLCLYVRESIAKTGMRDSFGILQLLGKSQEKSESIVGLAKKSWKPGGGNVFVFLLLT